MNNTCSKFKKCTECGENLLLAAFHKSKYNKDGLTYQCKECNKKRCGKYKKSKEGRVSAKKYRQSKVGKATREKYRTSKKGRVTQRKTRLKNTYNLTLEEHDKMLAQQNGVCAICHRPETVKNQYGVMRLAIDHDHDTGKVRGLLCYRCNVSLGGFSDITTLLAAAIYLKEND